MSLKVVLFREGVQNSKTVHHVRAFPYFFGIIIVSRLVFNQSVNRSIDQFIQGTLKLKFIMKENHVPGRRILRLALCEDLLNKLKLWK